MSMGSSMITPALVKELRERTGVGMAKCKEALEQASGDMEEAIAFLRKSGMASAAKKEGRVAKEGMVLAHETEGLVAIVEVDAETDFVVKNDRFQEFCRNVAAELALHPTATLEEFLQKPYSKDPNITIDQYRSLLIQTIGENILIRRLEVIKKVPGTSVGIYSHLGGKILTVVVVSSTGEERLAKDVAMHVAASSPEYLCPEQVPAQIVANEREIAKAQVKGKPENIMEKILQGKLQAFYDQCCLTRQKYIRDDSMSVSEYVKKQGAFRGKDVSVVRFLKWMAGKA